MSNDTKNIKQEKCKACKEADDFDKANFGFFDPDNISGQLQAKHLREWHCICEVKK